MIPRSRKRGLSDDTIIDTAVVNIVSSAITTGNRSHVHIGATPKARRKTSTSDEVEPRGFSVW